MSDLKLTEQDLRDPLWLRLQEHFEERLANHRARNDHDMTPEKTARLRGQIAEAKYLLALASQDPAPPADD